MNSRKHLGKRVGAFVEDFIDELVVVRANDLLGDQGCVQSNCPDAAVELRYFAASGDMGQHCRNDAPLKLIQISLLDHNYPHI